MRGDLGDKAKAELVPSQAKRFDDADRHRQRASLPGCGEDQLAVAARERDAPAHVDDLRSNRAVAHGRATPIIASRVTSLAKSSSIIPSVPCGRPGRTR